LVADRIEERKLPVALVLGSDVLSQFIITIDVPAKTLVIAMEK
jgi:hypothetical protein